MKTITIEWLVDEHDCETCGLSYSEGAKVKLNGEVILLLEPVAHCYGGQHYSSDEVYKAILVELGYEVKDENN